MTKDEFDRRWESIMACLAAGMNPEDSSPEATQAAADSPTEQHLRSAEKEIEFLKSTIHERDAIIESLRADKTFCESNFDQMRATIQNLRTLNRELTSRCSHMEDEVHGCVTSAQSYKNKAERLEKENAELQNKVKALEAAHQLDMQRLANAWQRSPLVDDDERAESVKNLKRRVNNTIRKMTAEFEKPVEGETPKQKELREFIASVGHLVEGMQ